MHVHDQAAKLHLVQSLRDGFDGSALLGHEEDSFPASNESRDEIGDGLGLTRPGRALDDERLAREHAVDGHVLAGVGVEYEELVCGWVDIGLAGLGIADSGSERLPGLNIAGHRGDDVALGKQFAVLLQVGDERHRRVGEDGCDGTRLDDEIGKSTP